MIQVIVGTELNQKPAKIYDENTTTLAKALSDAGIDTGRGRTTLNARPVTDLNKTFAEMGATGRAYLLQVSNKDNA